MATPVRKRSGSITTRTPRDRLTAPLRRRPDGTFEEIDWDTAIAEVAERLGAVRDEHGGESIFYYGGGGQGNHLGGTYASSTREVFGVRYMSNALAQEKTGEFWVDGQLFGRPRCHTTPGFRAGRGRDVRRQEPLALARLPALARRPEADRQGPGPVADRDRPAPHQDGCDGRLPPPGPARYGRVLPRRATRSPRAGGPDRRGLPGRANARRRSALRRARARAGRRVQPPRWARRGPGPRGRAAPGHRLERLDPRGPRDPAGAPLDAQLVPREAAVPPDRQLRQARRHELALRHGEPRRRLLARHADAGVRASGSSSASSPGTRSPTRSSPTIRSACGR